MASFFGKLYNVVQALNAIAPQGEVAEVSSFPLVVDVENKRVKAIWCDGGDITIKDLYGNSATFNAYTGWLSIPVQEITSYSNAGVVVLYLK